ncbi:MAG: hypothetical protein HC800_24295 [Phormidesmis sp. RL_2_1]|nr:hypothetical protein [Phormidesmis sp. RL_2_1]
MTAPTSAQEADYQQAMRADNFSLWNSGEMSGIAFDVWRRPAASGGGFYYFLWQGQYGRVADTGDPEVVVFFDSNIAQLKSELLTDCYNAPATSTTCLNPESKPAHYRYDRPCAFPWQQPLTAVSAVTGLRSLVLVSSDGSSPLAGLVIALKIFRQTIKSKAIAPIDNETI